MTKKTLFLGIFICLFVFLLYQFFDNLYKKNYLFINSHKIYIEIADSDTKKSKGLSGRKNLGENEGMLFVFPEKNIYPFWMKDMNFPLDFIWILDSNVVDLTENVLPINSDSLIINTIMPKSPINRVLEINAGKIKEWNIKIGDKILL